MSRTFKPHLKKLSATEGMAAVEFAVVLSIFLLMLLGIVEFGYDWYMKHAITNASRDGARYGALYRVNASGIRIAPNALSSPNTIQDVVNNYLSSALPAGSWSTTVSGAGYSNPAPGNDLTVQVVGTKTWSAIGSLIPSLENLTITVQTTMRCE